MKQIIFVHLHRGAVGNAELTFWTSEAGEAAGLSAAPECKTDAFPISFKNGCRRGLMHFLGLKCL